MADTTIRSRSNALIQRVGAVRAGLEPGTLLLEGDRLIDDARAAGVRLEVVLVDEARPERVDQLVRSGIEVRRVEAGLLQRTSSLKSSPGILALCAAPPEASLEAVARDPEALVLVVAGVADPGNLGALARAAEAFGAGLLCVARGGASPWNEKALRGSMGSLLRLPISAGRDAAALARELGLQGFRSVTAATRGGADPRAFDWTGRVALWVGGETGSLPKEARGFEPVSIPMRGAVESLNVTVAAALLLHCAGRTGGGT